MLASMRQLTENIMKKTSKYSAAILIFFIECNICYAERQLIPPNDVDLKSAYCVTVQKDHAALWSDVLRISNLDGSRVKKELTDSARHNLDSAVDRLKHLQLYLVPRLEYIDSIGLTGAIDRAKQDIQYTHSESIGTCMRQCASEKKEDARACIHKCAPEQFSRLRSCDDLSWLPF